MGEGEGAGEDEEQDRAGVARASEGEGEWRPVKTFSLERRMEFGLEREEGCFEWSGIWGRGVESDAVDLGELFGVAAGMGGGVRGARKGAWGLGMRTRRREGVLGGESSWLSLSKKEWSEGWCG